MGSDRGPKKDKRIKGKSLGMVFTQYVIGLGLELLGIFLVALWMIQKLAKCNIKSSQVLFRWQWGIIVSVVIGAIVLIIITAYLFTKQFKRYSETIFQVTDAIKRQDLDFKQAPIGIKEIDIILGAMEDMRVALKYALEHQWHMEQMRREQTSALAHDLKTPLTISQGYIDLLEISELNQEQTEYTYLARESLEQVKDYLKVLIETNRLDENYSIKRVEIDIINILKETVTRMNSLAREKQIEVILKIEEVSAVVHGDKIMLQRVFLNIIANAIDFSPQQKNIVITVRLQQEYVHIIVVDEGHGFSKEALKYGKEQFYMGDKSRGGKMHYGIGLYSSSQIITLHQGHMELANDSITGGGKVTLILPTISTVLIS